jgi:hypothetical protein
MSHSQFPPPAGIPLSYASERMCPACGTGKLSQPTFTWWGGLIGHKILGIERCTSCKRWWVKKTGRPGGTRVLIYAAAGIALGLLALSFFIMGV